MRRSDAFCNCGCSGGATIRVAPRWCVPTLAAKVLLVALADVASSASVS